MKKQLLQAAAAAALVAAMPAFAQNAAIVNGKPIPKARVETVAKQFSEQMARSGRPAPPDLQDRVKQAMIASEIMAQEAQKRGLDATDEFKVQLEMAKQEILANMLRENFAKTSAVTDEEVKAEYDKLVAANKGQEYKARHILVETEDQAKKVLADLKKGSKFEDLAKKQSKDPGSAAKGGDLDWTNPAGLVPEFAQAMTKLKKGETTEAPVKSNFGWHVIRLDDVRDIQFPKLEEVKPQLSQQMQQQKLQKFQDDLRAKAKVE